MTIAPYYASRLYLSLVSSLWIQFPEQSETTLPPHAVCHSRLALVADLFA
jgi:hypothetical protein